MSHLPLPWEAINIISDMHWTCPNYIKWVFLNLHIDVFLKCSIMCLFLFILVIFSYFYHMSISTFLFLLHWSFTCIVFNWPTPSSIGYNHYPKKVIFLVCILYIYIYNDTSPLCERVTHTARYCSPNSNLPNCVKSLHWFSYFYRSNW